MVSDCLKRELTQRPEDILKIVNKLIDDSIAGDAQARALLFERSDGKVPQAIVGDDDEAPITIKELVIRAIDATQVIKDMNFSAVSNRPPEESK